MPNRLHDDPAMDVIKPKPVPGKTTGKTFKHHLCILLVLAFSCLANSTRADVPPPAAKCDSEGAACDGSTIGLLGVEYNGTCVQGMRKFWYCKSGPMCYSAKGPGDAPSPGYGETRCEELIFANAPVVPSAMPSAPVAPPVEAQPAPSETQPALSNTGAMLHVFVLGVIFFIALFDSVVGLFLLASKEPYRVNGSGALWAQRTPELWNGEASTLLHSLYRRMGAFSFHTGVATAVWAWFGRNEPHLLTALLATYTITGLGFFVNDRRYFRGTRYFIVKQVLGALWAAALLAHIFGPR
jgi:hypothetical protein